MYANKSLRGKIFVLFPAFLVLFIFAGLLYLFFYYLIQNKYETYSTSVQIIFSIFHVINFLLLFQHFLLAIFTDPGNVSKEWSDSHLENVKFHHKKEKEDFLDYWNNTQLNSKYMEENVQNINQIYDFCFKCKIVKPHRAHHCGLCNNCRLLYDHHCPWVGNCVGYNNHKFFILFCLHVLIGTVFEAIIFIPIIYNRLINNEGLLNEDTFYIFLGILVCLMLSSSNGFLFCYHIKLSLNNQTTIERNLYGNKLTYKLNSIFKNFAVIFGENSITWFLPFKPYRPSIDPYNFTSTLSSINHPQNTIEEPLLTKS